MTEGQTKILNIYEENVIIVKQQLKKKTEKTKIRQLTLMVIAA